VVLDGESKKDKKIGPVIEGQKEQQSIDGIDGPSNFTDPVVVPATDIAFG
jgi:hypothetical protein